MIKHLLRAYLLILSLCLGYCLVCDVIIRLANDQVDHHNPQQALQWYQTLGQIAPGYPGVFAYQGWREYELKNYTQARVLGERALARDPKDPVGHQLLGQLAYLEEHYEEALKHWEHEPLGRGWAYWAMGRYVEARQSLRECPANTAGLEELRRALNEADPQ